MYLKNLKRVYISEPEIALDPLVLTLDSECLIEQTVTTVAGFLAVDAKNRNADLDSALATLAAAKNIATSSFRKEFAYSSAIDGAVIVYSLEYTFYTLA